MIDSRLLSEIVSFQPKNKLKKGEILSKKLQDSNDVLYIEEGLVKVVRISEQGDETVLYKVSGGNFCLFSLNIGVNREFCEVEVIALSDVIIRTINSSEFDALIKRDDNFRKYILNSLVTKITELIQFNDYLKYRPVKCKVVDYLLSINGSKINITQEEISQEIGSSREVVNRKLNYLKEINAIKINRKEIEIINRDILFKVCD